MFTWEEMTKRLKEDRVKNEETNTKKKLLPHQMFQKIMDLKKTKNKGGVMLSCRLEIWLKFADDLVNLSFNSWRNGEFWKDGDGDFGI